MDSSELATKMLDWEKRRRELDALEAEIKNAVLQIGKTQTVGNVRVSYSAGRRSFDYETPGKTADENIIADYTKTVTTVTTDWKMICDVAGIEPLVASQSEPTASVKLL